MEEGWRAPGQDPITTEGRLREMRRLPQKIIIVALSLGCFCLVAHLATDRDEYSLARFTPTNIRLEPTEYGQEETAFRTLMEAMKAGVHVCRQESHQDALIPQTVKLNLRI
jgi:hypothetical protein